MMQNLKKNLGLSPEIKACAVLGNNRAKIAELVQERGFFWKLLLSGFYVVIVL